MRIEEIALTRWNVEVVMLNTEINCTTKRNDVTPGSEATVHRVGEVAMVALQSLEKPEQARAFWVKWMIHRK